MTADLEEERALVALTRWVGETLLRELDGDALAALRAVPVAEALAAHGLELPAEAEEDAWLDERAADFHDLFLSPTGAPLVQSLWQEGRYEGGAAGRVRQLAESLGLSLDAEAARGAAPDHLGCILLLWAEARGRAPEPTRGSARATLRSAADTARSACARSGGLCLDLLLGRREPGPTLARRRRGAADTTHSARRAEGRGGIMPHQQQRQLSVAPSSVGSHSLELSTQ